MNCATRSFFVRKFGMVVMAGFLTALPLVGESLGQSTATKEFQKTLTLGASQNREPDQQIWRCALPR